MINFDELKSDDNGLVPVIIQDFEAKDVLMMAWMDREAYEKTLETGRMCYYSRSRQKLWLKGETSGNYQLLRELRYDCDGDCLLALIWQTGAACHTGERSCFYRQIV